MLYCQICSPGDLEISDSTVPWGVLLPDVQPWGSRAMHLPVPWGQCTRSARCCVAGALVALYWQVYSHGDLMKWRFIVLWRVVVPRYSNEDLQMLHV